MTSGAASCSMRSPGCPSTIRPGPSRRSSPPGPPTSPRPAVPRCWWSWAAARRRRPACCSQPLVGDFTRHLSELPRGGRRLVAFLGSTIGNFEPAERAGFLAELAGTLRPGDSFLLGTDLVKDPARLVHAMRDAGTLHRFVPFDIDPSVLQSAGAAPSTEYPGLAVEGLMTTPPASPRRSTRTCSPSSTESSRPTSIPTGSTTLRSGTPNGSGLRCDCARGSTRW